MQGETAGGRAGDARRGPCARVGCRVGCRYAALCSGGCVYQNELRLQANSTCRGARPETAAHYPPHKLHMLAVLSRAQHMFSPCTCLFLVCGRRSPPACGSPRLPHAQRTTRSAVSTIGRAMAAVAPCGRRGRARFGTSTATSRGQASVCCATKRILSLCDAIAAGGGELDDFCATGTTGPASRPRRDVLQVACARKMNASRRAKEPNQTSRWLDRDSLSY